MTAFVVVGALGEWDDWGATVFLLFLAHVEIAAATSVAGSLPKIAIWLMVYLLHQVIDTMTLGVAMLISRRDWLN
jgi:hypothetical protein